MDRSDNTTFPGTGQGTITCPKDLVGFRLELVHVLLKVVQIKSGSTVQKKTRCKAQGNRMCELERVTKIVLKMGR